MDGRAKSNEKDREGEKGTQGNRVTGIQNEPRQQIHKHHFTQHAGPTSSSRIVLTACTPIEGRWGRWRGIEGVYVFVLQGGTGEGGLDTAISWREKGNFDLAILKIGTSRERMRLEGLGSWPGRRGKLLGEILILPVYR